MDPITICGILGAIVTLYAIYVEKNAKPGFVSVCDSGPNASCSVVLTSEYARLAKKWFSLPRKSKFDVPNTYYGMLFYIAVILYPIYPFTLVPFREFMLMGASLMSISLCCYLGYVLYAKLKQFCAVCVTSYVINMAILYLAYCEIRYYL